MALKQLDHVRWLLDKDFKAGMRVTGLIYGDSYIIQNLEKEGALEQIANVACLPGILKHSYAMPDVHWGYGFPIGGVAAFSMDDGIISPGGVGYDISCGVRVMLTFLDQDEVKPHIDELTAAIFTKVPCGVGSKGAIKIGESDLRDVLANGALWAVKKGYGTKEDLECIEESGRLPHANASYVSKKALERGKPQLGTLGSGNHFLEIQVIDEIYDENVARRFGLNLGQVTVMIHCGSRGLGHQVCDDYIKVMLRAMTKYGIKVPDRQLCCAPLKSQEAREYLGAMQAAANYALANREIIGHMVRDVFLRFFPKAELKLLYDVSHNMAHIEKHELDGRIGCMRPQEGRHKGVSSRPSVVARKVSPCRSARDNTREHGHRKLHSRGYQTGHEGMFCLDLSWRRKGLEQKGCDEVRGCGYCFKTA